MSQFFHLASSESFDSKWTWILSHSLSALYSFCFHFTHLTHHTDRNMVPFDVGIFVHPAGRPPQKKCFRFFCFFFVGENTKLNTIFVWCALAKRHFLPPFVSFAHKKIMTNNRSELEKEKSDIRRDANIMICSILVRCIGFPTDSRHIVIPSIRKRFRPFHGFSSSKLLYTRTHFRMKIQ